MTDDKTRYQRKMEEFHRRKQEEKLRDFLQRLDGINFLTFECDDSFPSISRIAREVFPYSAVPNETVPKDLPQPAMLEWFLRKLTDASIESDCFLGFEDEVRWARVRISEAGWHEFWGSDERAEDYQVVYILSPEKTSIVVVFETEYDFECFFIDPSVL